MSDLISRSALIDSLMDCEMLSGRRTIDAVVVTIKAQPTVEAKPVEWIPCSERLPEKDTRVLATFIHGQVAELRYCSNGEFEGLFLYDTKVITAWMPLPAPYNAERGGKND